jgi:hypothetical protein
MQNKMNNWLSGFLILWTYFITSVMSFGILTSAHIGVITWGPTTDIWAMTIAISDIKYGLHGGIGYKPVTSELAKYLTTTGSEMNVGDPMTASIVDKPEVVTNALISASQLPKSIMPSKRSVFNSSNFVTTMAEDIGYADFYNIAFRLFGFNAYSTHYLYFAILFLSLTMYFLAYYRSASNIIIGALMTSSLFLIATSSSMFSSSVPNFAANRFISTLALFPLMHCILYLFQINKQSKSDLVYLILQAFLLAFTLSLRTSSGWMVYGYYIIMSLIVLIHYIFTHNACKSHMRPFFKNIEMNRIKNSFIILTTILSFYDATRYLTLNHIYRGQDVMPHHMFWHSGYIGLTRNPNWPYKIPYPELMGLTDDAVAWKLDDIYIKRDPKHYMLTPVNNGYKVRPHERIVRKEFLSFAVKNPYYMFQLYFHYKPYLIFYTTQQLVAGVMPNNILISMVGLLVAIILAIKTIRRNQALKIISVFALLWVVSFLPIMWAYPGPHVMSDQFLMTVLFFLIMIAMIIPIAKQP